MSLELKNISFSYNGDIKILKDVNLILNKGEILGLVAPSGYGKSTLGQIAARYIIADSGEVIVDGKNIDTYTKMLPVQMVHQHPEQAVNIRWKIKNILNEGWEVSQEIMEIMGIKKDWLKRFPTELSGGELQRICIARILNNSTRYIIADEITTMIDSISQVEILSALKKFIAERDIGILFISHDINLLRVISNRIVDLRDINKI